MKSPIPKTILRLMRLPGLNAGSRLGLRRLLNKRSGPIPPEAVLGAEAFFVHDRIGNIAFTGEGRRDSFRIAVTNPWFDQRITGVTLKLNGRAVAEADTFVEIDGKRIPAAAITRLPFVAGEPVDLICRARRLGRGLNIVEIDLQLDVAPMYVPAPVLMKGGTGRIAIVDPGAGELSLDIDGGPETEDDADGPRAKPPVRRLHFVPHIHYDVEWLRTSGVFEKMSARNLLEVLSLLERYPDYTFVLDQLPQLRAFERAHPERYARLANYVKEGRIEIVNGMVAEPDTNLVSGESLVMGSAVFQRWMQDAFGAPARVGWLIDSFGQSAQLPQILRKTGTEFFAFSRVIEDDGYASEFRWEGIDGSAIVSHYMPGMYFAGYPLPNDRGRAFGHIARALNRLGRHAAGDDLLLPAGIDHGRPQTAPAEHIPAWNESVPQTSIAFSTPTRFFETLHASDLRTVRGEFQRVFDGVWSVRPRIKRLNRDAEARIEEAEKLCTMAALSGLDYPTQALGACWETLLENQFHDRICSCVTDEAARHTEQRYESLLSVLDGTCHRAVQHLAARVAPAKSGRRLTVFNTLSFPRSEWVEWEIADAAGLERARLMADGEPIEFQVIDRHPYHDGALKSLTIGFVARIPPMGYRCFDFGEADAVQPVPGDLEVDGDTVRGAFWEFTVNPKRGTLKSVKPVNGDWTLGLGPVELLLERDRGEVMTPVVKGGGKKREKPARVHFIERGPLRAVLRTQGSIGETRFTRDLTFYRDLRRVDVDVRVDFRDPEHRLSLVVGTGVKANTWTHEVPYGAIEREGRELPAHRWADVSDGSRGVTILNHGVAGHELAGRNARLSLLRSHDRIHLFDAGPGGFSLGRHHFRLALQPHAGTWRDAKPWRRGRAFATPVRSRETNESGGDGKTSFSWFKVTPPSVVATAARVIQENVIELRLVECAGKAASGVIEAGFSVKKAEVTDMLGRPLAELACRDRKIHAAMGAFEILTLRLYV